MAPVPTLKVRTSNTVRGNDPLILGLVFAMRVLTALARLHLSPFFAVYNVAV